MMETEENMKKKIKEETTSDGRGSFAGGLANGNGMRVFCKEKKEKRNSQGKDPRTFREPSERWRVLKKRKEEKWKKLVETVRREGSKLLYCEEEKGKGRKIR